MSRKLKSTWHGNGFTLVEVMTAALLFAIIMLGATSFFSLSGKPSELATQKAFALSMAENDLEAARANGPAYVLTMPSTADYKGTTFTATRTSNTIFTGCAVLISEVSWTPAGSTSRSVTLGAAFNTNKYPWPS